MDNAFYLSIQSDDFVVRVLYNEKENLHISHLAVRPAQLNFVHTPQFMDVLS